MRETENNLEVSGSNHRGDVDAIIRVSIKRKRKRFEDMEGE